MCFEGVGGLVLSQILRKACFQHAEVYDMVVSVAWFWSVYDPTVAKSSWKTKDGEAEKHAGAIAKEQELRTLDRT